MNSGLVDCRQCDDQPSRGAQLAGAE
jgi:hypothetical protein